MHYRSEHPAEVARDASATHVPPPTTNNHTLPDITKRFASYLMESTVAYHTHAEDKSSRKKLRPSVEIQTARVANSKMPILRLPFELIGEISILSVHEYIRADKRWDIEPAALVLAAVCHRWRTIALAQPELWAQIPLNSTLHRTRLFIERSGNSLLSFYMFRLADHGRACVMDYYRGLANLLRTPLVSARIEKLVFHFQECSLEEHHSGKDWNSCDSAVQNLIPLLIGVDFPALRLLSFYEYANNMESGRPYIDAYFFSHCPVLQSLIMHDCLLQVIPAYASLPMLRTLHITGKEEPFLHYRNILAILQNIPQLHTLELACEIACDYEDESDEDSDEEPNQDNADPVSQYENIFLPYLRELSISRITVDCAAPLLSRMIYSRDARVHLGVHPGNGNNNEQFRAVLHHLIPKTAMEQSCLHNFVLSLDDDSASISSLTVDTGIDSRDNVTLEGRRLALMSMLRERYSWKDKPVTSADLANQIASQTEVLQDRQSRPQRHFTLRIFIDWSYLPFVHEVLAPEINTVSHVKLVIDAEDDDDSDDDVSHGRVAGETASDKWQVIENLSLPDPWMPVERLQVETYALVGFVRALLAIPDDPVDVLPIFRRLRGLDIRGMRDLDARIGRSMIDGLQRYAKVLRPLEHLCLEDADFSHEGLQHEAERLRACVLPGGLRIRTRNDDLEEKELDWDASIHDRY